MQGAATPRDSYLARSRNAAARQIWPGPPGWGRTRRLRRCRTWQGITLACVLRLASIRVGPQRHPPADWEQTL